MIESSDSAPSLAELARQAGLSPFHFHRLFREATGVTPKAYAVAHRAARVRGTLARSGSVTDAIYASGYGSNGRFYEHSNALLGMTPTRYRSGGPGESIRFGVGQSSLGAILVAASQKGICAIFLGNDPNALVRELENRFSRAALNGGDRKFERWMARVIGLVESPGSSVDLPLDIRGTAFQQKVWNALRRIPTGSTATYAEIAKRIGLPRAVRAVAGACASNRIAVAIPCHRVVRTDGGLSGYRWGVARKRTLLQREASRAA